MNPSTLTSSELHEALAPSRDGDDVLLTIHDGWDVHTIPHGGYLAALAGAAALEVSGRPDIFTLSVHYLRKAELGEVRVSLRRVGGSRRFSTLQGVAMQGQTPVLAIMASVGDRSLTEGPSWQARPPWEPRELGPSARDVTGAFTPPAVARRFGLRLETSTAGFMTNRTGPDATIRAVMDTAEPDQLTALLACDVTPPAVWNALGPKGWVPTLELTAHVRARPAAGPLRVEATTTHVTDGLLNEDALVHDSTGALIVQSRQLALWTA